jgi:hypothetical protein
VTVPASRPSLATALQAARKFGKGRPFIVAELGAGANPFMLPLYAAPAEIAEALNACGVPMGWMAAGRR